MTEEEAKSKWCPFARVYERGNRPFRAPRKRKSPMHDKTRCIGSECMAWRWQPGQGSDGGYCGLAGEP